MWIEEINQEVQRKLMRYKAKRVQALISYNQAKIYVNELELSLKRYKRGEVYDQLKSEYTERFMDRLDNFEKSMREKIIILKNELTNINRKTVQLDNLIRNLEANVIKRVWKEDKKLM